MHLLNVFVNDNTVSEATAGWEPSPLCQREKSTPQCARPKAGLRPKRMMNLETDFADQHERDFVESNKTSTKTY